MRLVAGDEAKPFDLVDVNGERLQLEQFEGRKLLLSFYRYVACPLCNLRIHKLVQRMNEFGARGLKVVAFFESPAERIRKRLNGRDIPFRIVGDPELKVYRAYGVESSWAGVAVAMVHPRSVEALLKGFMPGKLEGDKALLPADFLIGPDLKIHEAFYAWDITQHMPIEQIEKFLK